MKINVYNFLLKASGLSQREAAIFHDVRLDTIKGWCGGKTDAPLGALEEIAELILKQRAAADETLEQFDAAAIGDVELGAASDDYEAAALGWPSASAQHQALALIAADMIADGVAVSVVPRGSTVATAAAADVHETEIKPPRK